MVGIPSNEKDRDLDREREGKFVFSCCTTLNREISGNYS